jgi:hypothetical protein
MNAKNLKIGGLLLWIFILVSFIQSCQNENLSEEIGQEVSKNKKKPNIKVDNIIDEASDKTLISLKSKFRSKLKSSRNLDGSGANLLSFEYGDVRLDYASQIKDSLGQIVSTSYEVKEIGNNKDLYYNFVVDKENNPFLLKIEKIKNDSIFPENSSLVSMYKLDANLRTEGEPCPQILFLPPFGYYDSSQNTPVNGGGIGGGGSIGNINNPNVGGGHNPFFPPVNNGNSSNTGGGGSSGGGGDNFAIIEALSNFFDWFGDAISDAWNWFVNLFKPKPGCGCKRRSAIIDTRTRTNEGLTNISQYDCTRDGPIYVFIHIQDEYVDKINELSEFLNLTNNDKIFLYQNLNLLEYVYEIFQNNSNIQNVQLKETITRIINFTHAHNLDLQFTSELIETLINNQQPIYNNLNYPGKADGMPFEWWKDNEYMATNLIVVEGGPNAAEILVFGIFPGQALKHVENSIEAQNRAQELVNNGIISGGQPGLTDGKGDAFRHAYWNALGTATIGRYITKLFTDAHEAFASGLSKQMDLFNNQKGIDTAINMGFNTSTSNSVIEHAIVTELNHGNLKYIKNGVLTATNQ